MSRELPAELACHLAHMIKRTRHRYRTRLGSCQEHFSQTAVHDLRVETRRALALIDLVQALEVGSSLKKPRKTLKRRLDAFDELRDVQVGLLILEPLLDKFPEAVEFEGFLRERERTLVAQLRGEIEALKPRRVERMLKSLETDVGAARGAAARPAAVHAALAPALGAAFQAVATLRQHVRSANSEVIHRTRIAFKSFRYLCELLQPLLPWMTARRLREMHAWQTRMGDIQDIKVLLARMQSAVKRDEVSFEAVEKLHAALARRLVVLVNQFVRTADRLERFRPRIESDSKSKRRERALARGLHPALTSGSQKVPVLI